MKNWVKKIVFYIITLTTVLLLGQSCKKSSESSVSNGQNLFDMKVPFVPIEVKSTNGKVNLMYSIESVNFEKDGYKLKDFQVLNADNGKILCNISDTGKYLMIHRPSVVPVDSYYYPLAIHESYRFSVGLVLDKSQVPQKIKHRIIVTKDSKEVVSEAAETTVSKESLPILSPPLKGDLMIATNTTVLNLNHSSFQCTFKGKTTVPERFCVDWLKIDAYGRYYIGDMKNCDNWYGFGQVVYASSSGEVAYIQDGMPDRVPFTVKDNDTNLYNAVGNCVIIYTAGGYQIYAHLKLYSVSVELGQKVTSGQPIGKVGNSGNSDAPHLHFGLHSSFPYYISEGLPYYINSLEKLGSTGTLGGNYIKLSAPEQHTNELMENFGVYNLK
jgi:hypothetical protein